MVLTLVERLTEWRDKERARLELSTAITESRSQEAFSVGALWAFNTAIYEAYREIDEACP